MKGGLPSPTAWIIPPQRDRGQNGLIPLIKKPRQANRAGREVVKTSAYREQSPETIPSARSTRSTTGCSSSVSW